MTSAPTAADPALPPSPDPAAATSRNRAAGTTATSFGRRPFFHLTHLTC